MHFKTNSRRGFTLIELIVSVGLFTVVVTIAMTAYLRLISIDRKTRALNDVVTNLSFVVDSMERSIRTGTDYDASDSMGLNFPYGGGGANKFSYRNDQIKIVTYILVSTSGGQQAIGQCVGVVSTACNGNNAVIITDPRIDITSMVFYVDGVSTQTGGNSWYLSPGGDGKQPIVFFTIKGSIKPDPTSPAATFTIESAATERLLEI